MEIQLTTDGMKDFGYGIPYSMLNTDTLCNGKRRRVGGVWSPDSRYFAMTVSDNRAVKELWVINSMARPRPTLETYKYQMPVKRRSAARLSSPTTDAPTSRYATYRCLLPDWRCRSRPAR